MWIVPRLIAMTLLLVLAVPAPAVAADKDPAIRGAGSSQAIPDRYIVVLKDGAAARVDGLAGTLAGRHNGRVGHVYQAALHGFSVSTSAAQARRLAAEPEVAYVEQDQRVQVADTQENPPSWGLDRVDQRAPALSGTYSYDVTASNVTAYVIDSGIRVTHTEFGGRAGWGWDFIDNDALADDCNGHGTHVAGTIGGRTYGVAKAVKLVAVRVMDCNGFGSISAIVAGIDWVTTHAVKPAVANMSLEFFCNPAPCDLDQIKTTVNTAITNSVHSGVSYVVAAGNHNIDACTAPIASAQEAITVGNSAPNDTRSPTSNWGTCVNLFAPGTNIPSAGRASDTATATMSGTSMAAPHVTGTVALVLGRGGGWEVATPGQVTTEVVNTLATPNAIANDGTGSPSKLLYTGPPPVAGGSPIAVARNADGRLDLFEVEPGGMLYHRSQASLSTNAWTPRSYLQPNYANAVAAEAGADGRLQIAFTNRRDESVWHRSQAFVDSDNWYSWSSMNGLLTAVAMARDSDGRMELFGVNRNGTAYQSMQTAPNADTWTAWAPFGTFNPTDRIRAIAAQTNGSGQIEVFMLLGDGRIWHKWQTQPGGAWTPWWNVDGQLASIAVARNNSGALELIGVNTSGQVWRRTQAFAGTNNWFSWSQLDSGMKHVAAETTVDGRVVLFTVDTNHTVWYRWQTAPDASTWSARRSLGPLGGGPVRVPQPQMRVRYVDSEETVGGSQAATNVLDGNRSTIWYSKWFGTVAPLPHEIQLDLGGTYPVNALYYTARQGNSNGWITNYEVYVSADGVNWGTPVAASTFPYTEAEWAVSFPTKTGRYVRLRALGERYGNQWVAVAELNIGYQPATNPL
jgi:subtilisin family serine protease